MAHLEKFGIGACGNMLHHYTRDREAVLERVNIDETRTRLNYVIGRGAGIDEIRDTMEAVRESSGRAVRKDAVVMADWVVTAPADLRREDLETFFESCHDFVCERYGRGNILGAWVHMDEKTPHAHIAITPVVEREDGTITLAAKKMFDRHDLRTFHPDLGDRIERDLGYRPSIELSQDKALEKTLSKIDGLEAYKQAAQRLEYLQERSRELEVERERAAESCRELAGELRGLEGPLEEARERFRGASEARSGAWERTGALEERVRELEEKRSGLEERVRELEGERGRRRGRAEWLAGRLDRLVERIREREGLLGKTLSRIEGLEERIALAADELRSREMGHAPSWGYLRPERSSGIRGLADNAIDFERDREDDWGYDREDDWGYDREDDWGYGR